jgi:trigger factor
MEINRIAIDAVNEIISLKVVHMDYKGQVQKRINEKMPLATVKGFRKGQVPKDLVAKQYGRPIKIEEINKVVNLALERYIASERLNLLGTPIIKENEIFSWDNEELTFEYEIGLAPKFAPNLDGIEVTKYKIVADETMLNEQITRIQKQYGSLIPVDTIDQESEIYAAFLNEDAGINEKTPFELSIFKEQETQNLFIGKKLGDTITVNTKNLFHDDQKLIDIFNLPNDEVSTLEVDVLVTIETISSVQKAELNQELFDKLFGEGKIASIEDLKAKIKEDAEAQFVKQAEQKLTDDVLLKLIENNPFDLPKSFLIKWLQTAGEKQLTQEQAEIEYNRSEKGLRFQIIEGKIMAQSDVKVTFEDLKQYTQKIIRAQMAQFGKENPSDEDIEPIVAKILSNQDEVQQLSQDVVKQKTIEMIQNKATITEKEVTFVEFIKEAYGQ